MTARRTSTAAHDIVFDDDVLMAHTLVLTSDVEQGKDVCLTLDADANNKAIREIVAQQHS